MFLGPVYFLVLFLILVVPPALALGMAYWSSLALAQAIRRRKTGVGTASFALPILGLCLSGALGFYLVNDFRKNYRAPATTDEDNRRAAERYEKQQKARADERAAVAATIPSMQAQLTAIAAAEAAYRSANGGAYDNPECLARPAKCIPGYSGAPFLDPKLASLKPANGWTFSFHAGPKALPDRTRSPSSVLNYAVVAQRGGQLRSCIDARARVFDKLRDSPRYGICQSLGAEISIDLARDFVHTEGKSSCPQHLGSFRVFKLTPGEVVTHVRTAAPAPLSFGPDVSLSPESGSKEIDIFYTCPERRESFVAEVLVLGPKDGDPEMELQSKLTARVFVVR